MLWMSALSAVGNIAKQVFESAVGLRPPLPPGVPGPEVLAKNGDHRYYYRRFLKYGPIFTTLWGQRISVCIVGAQRGKRLLAQHAKYLLGASVELEPMVKHGVIRCMLGDTHAHYRKVLLAGMRPELPGLLEPQLRAIVRDVLDTLAQGRCEPLRPGQTPLHAATERVATRAMVTWMTGLAPSHPTSQAFQAALFEMGPAEMPGNHLSSHQLACFERVRTLMREVIAQLRAEPSRATLDGVVPRLVRDRNDDIDETVVGNISYALQQGRYDMGGLLRWTVSQLNDHPAVVEQFRAEPDEERRQPLAEAIVFETLRLEQATALHRVALEELEFDGYRIPKFAFVKFPLREGPHLDPAVFDEPDVWKPSRFVGRTYGADEYFPFGVSEHRCLGTHLVMKVATLLVDELVRGYAWTKTGDNVRTMGRYHWEPAPTFDIRLAPLAAVQAV